MIFCFWINEIISEIYREKISKIIVKFVVHFCQIKSINQNYKNLKQKKFAKIKNNFNRKKISQNKPKSFVLNLLKKIKTFFQQIKNMTKNVRKCKKCNSM